MCNVLKMHVAFFFEFFFFENLFNVASYKMGQKKRLVSNSATSKANSFASSRKISKDFWNGLE